MVNVKRVERHSNFELLRIICMVLIVAHHFSCHADYVSTISSINSVVIKTLIVGGRLGVNVYVLISGYFLINSKFNIKKIVKIVVQVLFYSLLIYFILLASGQIKFSLETLFKMVFPILTSQYWFITCYVLMLILSPFINVCLKNCTQNQHLTLIFILLFVQILMPLFFYTNLMLNVGWFITLYIISAYFRLYPHKIFNNNKIMVPIALITFLAMIVFNVFFNKPVYDIKNITCFICSITLFCSFKNFNIKSNKLINYIASLTLGVYLIHEHSALRPVLWNKIIKAPMHSLFVYFPIYAICSIVIVFLVCCVIDFIRIRCFNVIDNFIKRKTNLTNNLK
ncbi:MAG: acyltransferase [Clostridia bacterium]|nr:acyltransferase [Clostridia bacterium]